MSRTDFYQMHAVIHSKEMEELKNAVKNFGGKVIFGEIDDYDEEDEDDKEKIKALQGPFAANVARPCVCVNLTHGEGPQDVYINEIRLDEDGYLEIIAEQKEWFGEFELDPGDISFGHVGFIIDAIPLVNPSKSRTIWMRLGVSVELSEEEAEAILDPNKSNGYSRMLIFQAFNQGRISINGNSYIPESCIEEYNEAYGTSHEVADIDFEF